MVEVTQHERGKGKTRTLLVGVGVFEVAGPLPDKIWTSVKRAHVRFDNMHDMKGGQYTLDDEMNVGRVGQRENRFGWMVASYYS